MISFASKQANSERRAARLVIFGALAFATLLPADELPGRDEYAYGFPLASPGGAEYFAADLPLAVYRSVTDPRMRDIAVFNADGLPVPRLVERPPAAAGGGEQQIALGLVPLYGKPAEQIEQLRLLLLREPDRTRLELDTERATDAAPRQTLTGYLVDTRELEPELQALELNWPQPAEGFISTVRLDTSDDLLHWRHVGTSALADLKFEESRIEQNRLPLAGPVSDYLRISWGEMPDDWRLDSARGIFTGERAAENRGWLELKPASVETDEDDRNGGIRFEAGGYPPVDRVQLLLPEDNVVVRARIHYRPPGQESWRLAHDGVFYQLSRQGNRLQSPAAVVGRGRKGPLRAGEWKVTIDSGVTAGPVRLQLGWRPDRLLFLAQGTAPFELVGGRARDEPEQFPQQTVLGDRSLFRMLREAGEAGEAAVGERIVIAGRGGLEFSESLSWKTMLVWAGLIAAVAVVAWLVYSLLRENRP